MTSPSDGDSLATLLRRHRAEAGLTQEELAERAGTSSRTVSDIERGLRGAIYRYTAARLAEALELSAEERSRFQAAARARRPADLRPPRQPGPGEGSSGRAMLPSPLTPLIAREKEISTALQTLRAGARLLTLTGPGGIGKTRVALEVMARGQEDFEHGVFLASLAANPDPALVPAIVASVLGAPAEREPLVPTIAQHVGERRVLLACDTFEHVLDAAPLIADLLASCPRLAVLVTSRTPLRLQGEQEMSIPPLALPSLEVVDAFDVTRFSAVTLFIQRAQAVRSELPVDEATLPLIADICRRLEGIPLALELAAARVKHLPLPALAANLEHRLSVLTGGPRDVPERHQAMRDTIAWSYELLTPAEQRLFRQLSVFGGSATLDAVEVVCALNEDSTDVLDTLSGLVDKSLVSLSSAVAAEPRYGMLDVVREFSAERLRESGEEEVVSRRHAEYYLAVAEEAEPHLGGAAQDVWYRRLNADRENLRAALRWSLRLGEQELALRHMGALWQFWRRRGDLAEARNGLDAALSLAGNAPDAVRGKALWGAAWIAFHQGDHARSGRLGEELLALAGANRGAAERRNALTVLGMVAMAESRDREAVVLFEEALEAARALGAAWLLATSLMNLGVAVMHAGETRRARGLLGEAVDLYAQLGDRVFMARARVHLAQSHLLDGNVAEAEALFRDCLVQLRRAGERMGTAEALEGLAATAAARGAMRRTPLLLGAAAALRETEGSRQHPFDARISERFTGPLRELAGPSAWEAGLAEGRRMPLDKLPES